MFYIINSDALREILSYMDIHDIPAVAIVSTEWRETIRFLLCHVTFWDGIIRHRYPELSALSSFLNDRQVVTKRDLVEQRIMGRKEHNCSHPRLKRSYQSEVTLSLDTYVFLVDIYSAQNGRESVLVTGEAKEVVSGGKHVMLDLSSLGFYPGFAILGKENIVEIRLAVHVVNQSGGSLRLIDKKNDNFEPDDTCARFRFTEEYPNDEGDYSAVIIAALSVTRAEALLCFGMVNSDDFLVFLGELFEA